MPRPASISRSCTSRRRQFSPSIRYSLSPERYSRRISSTSLTISGGLPRPPRPWRAISSACRSTPAPAGYRRRRGRRDSRRHPGQLQPHFGGRRRLARVAAAEDHVLHAIAAQALGALLAEHPGQRIDDVALAAAVGPDDRGDASSKVSSDRSGKLLKPAISIRFNRIVLLSLSVANSRHHAKTAAPETRQRPRPGSGWDRFDARMKFGGVTVT